MDNFYLKMCVLIRGNRLSTHGKFRKVLYSDSPAISLRYYKEIFNYKPLLIKRKNGVINRAFLLYNQQIIEVKHYHQERVTNECVLHATNISKEYLELAGKALILKPLTNQLEKKTFSLKDANGNVLHYQE